MHKMRLLAWTVLLWATLHTAAQPKQFNSTESSLGAGAMLLTNVLQGHNGFTAVVRIDCTSEGATLQAHAGIARLNNRFRLELDLSTISGTMLPLGMSTLLKTVGAGQLVDILDLKNSANYQLVPKRQSWCGQALDWNLALSDSNRFRRLVMDKKPLGREQIGMMLCTKYNVYATDARTSRSRVAGQVWRPGNNNPKGFPLRIKLDDGKTALDLTFSQVTEKSPDSRLFKVPATFKRCDSLEQLFLP